ncbi:MAG TPA: hypothetical protein VEV13_04805 [Candidatus Limnocylindria bacterium]|nr:hypothetical protein [Candidatus Limnocylindria bacterium]
MTEGALLASAWVGLGRLTQETPRELDDAIVRPGWIGFGMFLALVVASVFLFRSMNKQLKKVDFVEEPVVSPEPGAPPASSTPPAQSAPSAASTLEPEAHPDPPPLR